MSTSMRIFSVTLTVVAALGFCACGGGGPGDQFAKDQNGKDFDLTGVWVNVYAGTNETAGGLALIGDIGISISSGVDNDSFSYSRERSYQTEGGAWLNEYVLTCNESETGTFTVGANYYTTVFVGENHAYFNVVLNDSLPYETSGHDYPSSEFPIFRQYVE